MIKPNKLFDRILQGQYQNISFNDFVHFLNQLGFEHERTTGSHMIFRHQSGAKMNIQPDRNNDAKPFQVKQLKEVIKVYKLTLGD